MGSHAGLERSPPESSALKKRTASLLPAFELHSSSPSLPNPLKRTRDALEESSKYPTPIPTSSTAIYSSSPPANLPSTRPGLQRSASTRGPLQSVPIVQLPEDGKSILMGRSSLSSDVQLSANRLISRVHVHATYRAGLAVGEKDRVEIFCSGHNGVKVHCLGRVYEVLKGKTFSSDVRGIDIMVDVHDARVSLRWPEKTKSGVLSSSDEEESPSMKRQRSLKRHSTPPSPAQPRRRLASPISPSPAVRAVQIPSSPVRLPNSLDSDPVVVYEDIASPRKENVDPLATSQSTQAISQKTVSTTQLTESSVNESHEYSDHDEENDPIIHSFGPFGANLLPRMASFTTRDSSRTVSPGKKSFTKPLLPSMSPSQGVGSAYFDIRGHVINQLAFCRLSSTPLSTILSHLPEEAGDVGKNGLQEIIDTTGCIGEVRRAGKDAAGHALESEYYYIADHDSDEGRRTAVVNDLQKPGLRACRKQHKVSFSPSTGHFYTDVACSNIIGESRRSPEA